MSKHKKIETLNKLKDAIDDLENAVSRISEYSAECGKFCDINKEMVDFESFPFRDQFQSSDSWNGIWNYVDEWRHEMEKQILTHVANIQNEEEPTETWNALMKIFSPKGQPRSEVIKELENALKDVNGYILNFVRTLENEDNK
jgi:hypothetical protein